MKKIHTRFACRTLLHAVVLLLISSTVAMSADNSCKGLFKVRSQNSNTPTTITFVNKAKTDRAILWLDGLHKKIPAVGAPSASARTAHRHENAAGYNLFQIAMQGNAWRCEMVARERSGDGSISEVERQVLL